MRIILDFLGLVISLKGIQCESGTVPPFPAGDCGAGFRIDRTECVQAWCAR